MESQDTGLGSTVVDQRRSTHIAPNTRNRNDMTFLLLEHLGEEFLDKDEVTNNVDFEDLV